MSGEPPVGTAETDAVTWIRIDRDHEIRYESSDGEVGYMSSRVEEVVRRAAISDLLDLDDGSMAMCAEIHIDRNPFRWTVELNEVHTGSGNTFAEAFEQAGARLRSMKGQQ